MINGEPSIRVRERSRGVTGFEFGSLNAKQIVIFERESVIEKEKKQTLDILELDHLINPGHDRQFCPYYSTTKPDG